MKYIAIGIIIIFVLFVFLLIYGTGKDRFCKCKFPLVRFDDGEVYCENCDKEIE